METVFLVAKILSAIALLALVAALVNLWRRPGVPSFSYGRLTLSQRRLKGLWCAFLIGALAVAASKDPILTNSRDTEERVPASADVHPRPIRTGLDLPLPFYHYERTARRVNGEVVEEHIREGVVFPWSFLWALLAYYVLVVRWNPDSRWARRILEGRKRPKRSDESGDAESGGEAG